MDQIEKRAEFDYIRYANCWEDTDILLQALQPTADKRLLSIASAGDNSLSLLIEGADVVAADLNSTQLAAVELRAEAMRELDRDDCLAFLGVTPSDSRPAMYRALRPGLSAEAAAFWDSQEKSISEGVIHAGKFERYFQTFRRFVLPLIHSRKTIGALIQAKTAAERRRFYEETWANTRWHLLFRIFFSRFVMGRMGRDPEFFRYVDGPVSESILKRTRYALTELPTHDNPYLTYILTGNYQQQALPHYLRPGNYEKIKANLDNLTLCLGTVQEAAGSHGEGGFDGFNLSDIFEYLDLDTSTSVYSALLQHANSGARFVYWNMLAPRSCGDELSDRMQPLRELSDTLFRRDKAFFYSRFVVEEKK